MEIAVAIGDSRSFVTGIHPPTLPQYPDDMAAADPVTSERRRFAMWQPRRLWIGAAADAGMLSGWRS